MEFGLNESFQKLVVTLHGLPLDAVDACGGES